MELDPSPVLANLFLYYDESKWMKKIIKIDIRSARIFENTFRFVDDSIMFSDVGEFDQFSVQGYLSSRIET